MKYALTFVLPALLCAGANASALVERGGPSGGGDFCAVINHDLLVGKSNYGHINDCWCKPTLTHSVQSNSICGKAFKAHGESAYDAAYSIFNGAPHCPSPAHGSGICSYGHCEVVCDKTFVNVGGKCVCPANDVLVGDVCKPKPPPKCEPGSVLHGYKCEKCPPGTFADQKKNVCTPCTGGTVSSASCDKCVPCTGNSVPDSHHATCVACKGISKADANHDKCTCPAGTGFDSTGTCQRCAGNTASNDYSKCAACTYNTVPNLAHNDCIACTAGNVPDKNNEHCTPCGGNTIPDAHNFKCVACPYGKKPNVPHTQCV